MYYTFDGQRRMTLAELMGLKEVPCMVYISSGPEEEAQWYEDINEGRIKLNVAQRFKASITHNDPQSTEINEFLKSCGYDYITIGILKTFVRTWDVGPEHAKEALRFQVGLFDKKRIKSEFHRGFHYLCKRGILRGGQEVHLEDFRKKVSDGTYAGLNLQVKEYANETAAGSRTDLACALAVLHVINYRLRGKVEMKKKPGSE